MTLFNTSKIDKSTLIIKLIVKGVVSPGSHLSAFTILLASESRSSVNISAPTGLHPFALEEI